KPFESALANFQKRTNITGDISISRLTITRREIGGRIPDLKDNLPTGGVRHQAFVRPTELIESEPLPQTLAVCPAKRSTLSRVLAQLRIPGSEKMSVLATSQHPERLNDGEGWI